MKKNQNYLLVILTIFLSLSLTTTVSAQKLIATEIIKTDSQTLIFDDLIQAKNAYDQLVKDQELLKQQITAESGQYEYTITIVSEEHTQEITLTAFTQEELQNQLKQYNLTLADVQLTPNYDEKTIIKTPEVIEYSTKAEAIQALDEFQLLITTAYQGKITFLSSQSTTNYLIETPIVNRVIKESGSGNGSLHEVTQKENQLKELYDEDLVEFSKNCTQTSQTETIANTYSDENIALTKQAELDQAGYKTSLVPILGDWIIINKTEEFLKDEQGNILKFDTEFAAQTYLNNLAPSQDIIEGSIKKSTEQETTTTTITETITKTFKTLEALENYVKELETAGYKVDYTYTTTTEYGETDISSDLSNQEDDGKYLWGHLDILSTTKITILDDNDIKSEVTGNISVNSVKINNEEIEMSPDITHDEFNNYYEIKSANDHWTGLDNLDIRSNSYIEVTGKVTYTIEGITKELDFVTSGYLVESKNECSGWNQYRGYDLKINSITIKNDKVIIESNIITSYESEITIEKEVFTILVTNATYEQTKSYQVIGTKDIISTTCTYNYNIYEETTNNKYILDIQAQINPISSYQTSFQNQSNLYQLTLSSTTFKNYYEEEENLGLGNGDLEELPPKTGIDDILKPQNNSLIIILVSLIIITITIPFLKENNK